MCRSFAKSYKILRTLEEKIKMIELKPSISIITLSLNGQSVLMKRKRMSGQIKCKTRLGAVYKT